MLGRTKKIHFVGIGGIGMSGIAEFLHNQGFIISGSDLYRSEVTDHLAGRGITIYDGHDPAFIQDIDVVVKSSAVKNDNPEISAALNKNIPVIRRAEMLAEIMRMSYGIAIAGTHGKTTTTSIVGLILKEADLDPTVIVGGKVKNFGSNNVMGCGKFIVVEADEYDRSFLSLTPIIAGITNIEADHLDCYENLDDIKRAFTTYANTVPFFGCIIACLDDHGVQSVIPFLNKRIITYGISELADLKASNIEMNNFISEFDVIFKDTPLGRVKLNIPGIHNIQNALLALTIAQELDISFRVIQKAIESFTGVYRRFELKGKYNDILVYDDYAHHPTEIMATLKGIRESTGKRIVAVFQPHLFTRTRDFYQEFGSSFFSSDVLVVTPIYAAREKPLTGITSELIVKAAIQAGHQNVTCIYNNDEIVPYISSIMKPDDIIITLGAGDIYKYGELLLNSLSGVSVT
ncbi:MAG: UDP-N-acetylmuramate--L-alanine ligase [Candidatus Cloacimonetes bacterium]|nr:UDP-N-acetylmuramate--L-alanine ligase [Candidatus Cloacimonadota bacterium]